MSKPLIYVVDRNPATRQMIRFNLEEKKMPHVHTFPDEDECLYRIRKGFQPDILISGCHDGHYSASDFLDFILEVSPSTRVVFFADFMDPLEPEMLMERGAADYVCKTGAHEKGIRELVKNVLYLAGRLLPETVLK
jgi:DNA-binding NarL/FixJ family response regulator